MCVQEPKNFAEVTGKNLSLLGVPVLHGCDLARSILQGPPKGVVYVFHVARVCQLAFPPRAGHIAMRLAARGARNVAPTRSAGRCRARSANAPRCSDRSTRRSPGAHPRGMRTDIAR